MKFSCPNCHAAYRIRDIHRKTAKKIKVTCHKCKEIMIVDLRLQKETPSSLTRQSAPKTGKRPETPVTGEALKNRIFRRLTDLPPMPNVVIRAQQVMADPESSLRDLVEVIQMDQALTVNVLRMANSAYYGIPGKVSSVRHAVVLLGQKVLSEVVVMAGVKGLLGSSLEGYNLEAGDLWRHSMAVAMGSKIITERLYPELLDVAFVAGLLHDAGKLMLDAPVLERKDEFDAFMANDGATFLSAETEIFGFDHSEIAAEMCKRWKIPDAITKAIRNHHYPSRSDGDELSYVLHVADYVA
ncbi:HDOD domain-containing protein, partial [candidate division KSB3 bacterium]|nr:HDOD domain-containing protein [candidate division KSB3 bacterium]